jgi:YidC/Oxa1 family membrane protein insertase
MTTVPANVIQDAFSPLISVFQSVLVFIHDHIASSWGLSIIGLTIVVRAVLVPLTISQFRSMAKMQRLQPQMKALQARHKGDRQKQSEELMKLYKQNNVNPFASCLPLVLQLPVFISLFYMLRTNLKKDICGSAIWQHVHNSTVIPTPSEIAHLTSTQLGKYSCNAVQAHSAKFLFIPDITSKTTGITLVVLLILYVGSQLGSSLVMTVTADVNQRRMMIALPLVFTLFIFSFPGGLLVYWITTNFWTLGQSMLARRFVGRAPPPPVPPEGGGGGGGGGGPPKRGGGQSSNGAAGEKPALAGVGAPAATRSSSPPPRPPRKRKKRSGRRR